MGKEIGKYAPTRKYRPQGIYIVVLAFFSVVASSPNLSTFLFCATKLIQKKYSTKKSPNNLSITLSLCLHKDTIKCLSKRVFIDKPHKTMKGKVATFPFIIYIITLFTLHGE